MGLDIPDIYCIIYLGRPCTLLDYGQESGPAGHNGQKSKAVLVLPELEPPVPWDPDQAPLVEDQALVQRYLHVVSDPGVLEPGGTPYRYVVLDGYLDGEIGGYHRQYCEDTDAAD
jgi:superfamily II DNA helicase RecQ